MAHFERDTVVFFISFLQRPVGGKVAYVLKIKTCLVNIGWLPTHNAWKMDRYNESKYRVAQMSMVVYVTVHI